MAEETLGKVLISSIQTALADKECGRVVRPDVDVAAIRKKLELTQKQFAQLYHIKLETLRNWEQHKRALDTTTLAYLICIAKRPKLIRRILSS